MYTVLPWMYCSCSCKYLHDVYIECRYTLLWKPRQKLTCVCFSSSFVTLQPSNNFLALPCSCDSSSYPRSCLQTRLFGVLKFGIPKNSPGNDEISYIFMSETSENSWFPKKSLVSYKRCKHTFFLTKKWMVFPRFHPDFLLIPKLGPCCDGCDRPVLAGYHHHSKRPQQPLWDCRISSRVKESSCLF